MENNSTPKTDETHSSSAPNDAPIILNCLVLDTSAKHPVRCADVVLFDGETEIMATTSPEGQIKLLIESETNSEWQDLEIPHAGEWGIKPNTKKYDTHYFFSPATFRVNADGTPTVARVDGDYYKNVQQLETYVENVFLSGRDTFMAEMRRYDPKTLTEEQVEGATRVALSIVNRGLAFIVEGKPFNLPDGYNIDDETIAHLCKVFRGGGEDRGLRDKILCSLCYTRYSTNQARLNTCLCCEPCIPG